MTWNPGVRAMLFASALVLATPTASDATSCAGDDSEYALTRIEVRLVDGDPEAAPPDFGAAGTLLYSDNDGVRIALDGGVRLEATW